MTFRNSWNRAITAGWARPLLLLAVLILLSGFSSCGRQNSEPLLSPLAVDEVDGARLWRRITVESDFHNYAQWPDHDGMRPGQSPHGVWHSVYANRTLFDALPAADAVAPEGSIIVKENFNADKELRTLTVMAKVRGWDEEHNDWFWANFSPDGTVNAEGKVGGCISCHEGMERNDYVIINPLDEEP